MTLKQSYDNLFPEVKMSALIADSSPFVYSPKATERILGTFLARLQQRLQPQFDLPLKRFYCGNNSMDFSPAKRPNWNPEAELYLPDPYFYVATVAPRNDTFSSWLYIRLFEPWLLEDENQNMIFSIHPGFYGERYGRKEINCQILDPQIMDIARQELEWYAEKTDATQINCSGLPGAKNHFRSCFCL
ncbi:MAG: hypothetical protein P1P90_00020 [Patescibacteria group bacterium]|nr:hypothetical protein [Patescibacteria group bacterium]